MNKKPVHQLGNYFIKPISCSKHSLENARPWKEPFISLALTLFVALVAFWRIKTKIVGIEDPYFLRDFYYAYYPAGHLVYQDPGQLYEGRIWPKHRNASTDNLWLCQFANSCLPFYAVFTTRSISRRHRLYCSRGCVSDFVRLVTGQISQASRVETICFCCAIGAQCSDF